MRPSAVQPLDETGMDVQAVGHEVPELVDQPVALIVGHRHELVHQADLFLRGVLPHDGPQDGPARPELLQLLLDQPQMRGGQVVQSGFRDQHPADVVQSGTQVAQGAHEFEPRDGVHVVLAEAALGQAGGRDDALIGVEPDRAHAQAGAAGDIADGVELVHSGHYGFSSGLRVKDPKYRGSAPTCDPGRTEAAAGKRIRTRFPSGALDEHVLLRVLGAFPRVAHARDPLSELALAQSAPEPRSGNCWRKEMDMTDHQNSESDADDVERHTCPRCLAQPGSPSC